MPELLESLIRERIQSAGPIPFPEFMATALYHPEHGYYSSGRAVIGRGGDFYTSVSVGPIFGRLLARQFTEMWEKLHRPKDFTIVEQGSHGGDFARDILEALQTQTPEFYASATYQIVEPSPALRQRQTEALEKFSGKIQWAADLREVPEWTGVHFSNELIDALPVYRVRWTGNEWKELLVGLEEEAFTWAEAPLSDIPALRTRIAQIPQPLPPGYETEINLAAGEWLKDLSTRLLRGWVIAIDYGHPRAEFFRPDRKGGTLAAYSEHKRVENPLLHPGTVDLTAHVEFTSVAEYAQACGLQLSGFTDQHHLMVGLSRLHFADISGPMSPEYERDLRGFKTLMHPGLMGMSFKAIAFSKGVDDRPPLAGFAFARDAAQELGLR